MPITKGDLVSNNNQRKNNMITREQLLSIGFENVKHFTVGDSMRYKLSRGRHISISSIGTGNESIYICDMGDPKNLKIDDAICLHNYDRNGFISLDRMNKIIDALDI